MFYQSLYFVVRVDAEQEVQIYYFIFQKNLRQISHLLVALCYEVKPQAND